MARLFGSREIVLGAATLLARGKTRRNLILAGVGVDAADTVAAVLAGESGSVDRTDAGAARRTGGPRRCGAPRGRRGGLSPPLAVSGVRKGPNGPCIRAVRRLYRESPAHAQERPREPDAPSRPGTDEHAAGCRSPR